MKKNPAKESQVLRKFRLGVKQACGEEVWKNISAGLAQRGIEGTTRVAKYLGMGSHASVSKVEKGDLSADMLFTTLTALGWDCGRLDPLPEVERRALRGYQFAVHYLRTGGDQPTHKNERITKDVFVTMCVLISDEVFEEMRSDRHILREGDWRIIARSIQGRVDESVGTVPYEDGRGLGELYERWGIHVQDCLFEVPFKRLLKRIIGKPEKMTDA